MIQHPMTWALAGRMAVWTILAIVGYALFVLAIARLMAWLGSKYPRLYTNHAEYYEVPDKEAVEYFPPDDDDAVAFRLDSPQEAPEPPRTAA